ncbi:MAG: divalent metal cation transporter [Candidatus Dormiibacterota bacterium]
MSAVRVDAEQLTLEPPGRLRSAWGRPTGLRAAAGLGLLAVIGPGLMVMLADTDVGSVVTAAQSGAEWGYRLLPLEVVLIPVLYLVMELTARLGIATGKGHAALIKERFGRGWALLSVATLGVTAVGALVTEFAGIAGVASLVGLSPNLVVPAAAVLLALVVVSGTYRRVELIGISLGLFEVAFLVAAIQAHPDPASLARSLWAGQPFGNGSYLALAMANVGAVVMPWMLFYQQAAIVDKRLTARNLRAARVDIAVGAVITQVVMIAVLVATGATLAGRRAGSLATVSQISNALEPSLGPAVARLAFALGVTGAALVAAIVVSLAASWAVAELGGKPRSLNRPAGAAPLFYGAYFCALIVAAVLVLTSASLVRLAVDIEILNAILLPIVLGFLVALAWTVLPAPFRLRRVERLALLAVIAAVVVAGLAAMTAAVRL